MAIRGTSVRDTVFRAFYTMQNADVQSTASLLGALAMGGVPPAGLSPRVAMDATVTFESDSLYVSKFDGLSDDDGFIIPFAALAGLGHFGQLK